MSESSGNTAAPPVDPGAADYAKNPQKYHNKCVQVVQNAIDNNPFLKIMMESMKNNGCEITPEFFKCRACPIKIVLCENQITFQTTLEDTLMHEMVHAYDVCRAEIDTDDCLHTACTEIRAANLSGECDWTRELYRGKLPMQKGYPACVKRRAESTLRMQPGCAAKAPFYVEAAWRSCYRDTAPYAFVPK